MSASRLVRSVAAPFCAVLLAIACGANPDAVNHDNNQAGTESGGSSGAEPGSGAKGGSGGLVIGVGGEPDTGEGGVSNVPCTIGDPGCADEPGCGDAHLDAGEACDDGNSLPGD